MLLINSSIFNSEKMINIYIIILTCYICFVNCATYIKLSKHAKSEKQIIELCPQGQHKSQEEVDALLGRSPV